MFVSLGIFFVITVLGLFWALGRLFQYSSGKYSDYIIATDLAWIFLIVVILVPFLIHIVVAYILFWCKSSNKLMGIRAEAIKNLTPEDVVENAADQIINKDLISDEWVVGNWHNSSKSEWIERISSNRAFLEQALDRNMKIHANGAKPYVAWINVIKHYLYLEKNAEVNATVEK